jgi:hypothetical protein
LLKPFTRQDRVILDLLIADNFYEIGASGNVYHKKDILEALPLEQQHDVYGNISEFEIALLSDTFIRAHYLLQEKDRLTRRTSLWQKDQNSYQMIFHQGTVIQP